jgi:hypothetical protein
MDDLPTKSEELDELVYSDSVVSMGEYRQKLQIEQSLARLQAKPCDDHAQGLCDTMEAQMLKDGVDTSRKVFIQDMEVICMLVRGVIERHYTIDTEATMTLDMLSINMEYTREVK